jgi:hypothetical protein
VRTHPILPYASADNHPYRDGLYGLYLDDTLLDGSSACCPMFDNKLLCSAGTRKGGSVTFECVGLEV